MTSRPRRPLRRPRLRAVAAALAWALFGAVGCSPQGGRLPRQAVAVKVALAARQPVAFYLEALSSLDGYVDAEIRARVRGWVEAQLYKDGSWVSHGQPLFRLDGREHQAAVDVAQGNLSRAEAGHARYRAQLRRYRPLAAQQAVSQQDLDDAVAAERDAAGQVNMARGQLDQAQLNLGYTRIHAPLAGLAGTAQVRTGNLVGQDGATLLCTVSQLDPMRASFPIAELDYLKYPLRIDAWAARDLAWAQRQFALFEAGAAGEGQPIDLILADGSHYPRAGVVVAADRQIDASTGTIQVQALFPNPQGLLRPGQYARVRMRRRQGDAMPLVVPERAIRQAQGLTYVWVVSPRHIVSRRGIEVGQATAGMRVVQRGLEEGESVVVDGVQKLRDALEVSPTLAPPAPAAAPP